MKGGEKLGWATALITTLAGLSAEGLSRWQAQEREQECIEQMREALGEQFKRMVKAIEIAQGKE